MISPALSVTFGILFVLLAMGAVWLMFDASRCTPQSDRASRLIRAHRIAGYLFIALFCLMTWFMTLRIKDTPDALPLPTMLHALIAAVLALLIFVLAFVLIAGAAGPYLLRTVTMQNISLEAIDMGSARIDVKASEALMQ